MSISKLGSVAVTETTDLSWKSLYKIGGAAALVTVLIYLLDSIIVFVGVGTEPGVRTATDWFTLIQGNWFLEFRNLGFLNIISMTLGVPIFLALYAVHRQGNKAYAALAAILSFIGMAIYISNNPAIPMFALSGKYAAATTDAQRSLLSSAGEAILARGEDFTPGFFMGFFLGEIAYIVISFVMLRGGIFGRATAYTGIIGFVSMILFTIWSTFVPVLFDVAMIFAMVGGLLSMAWLVLIARRLFQLGYPGSQSICETRAADDSV